VGGVTLRIALASVHGAVSRYPVTPALLAIVVGLGAGFAISPLSLEGRLSVPPTRGGDLGLYWRSGVQPPAVIQQEAVDALGRLLSGVALGILGITAVTILILSLAREAERARELSVRRAVGASRGALVGSDFLECGLVLLIGTVVAAWIAVILMGLVAHWPGTLRSPTWGRPALAAGALVLLVLAGMVFPVLFPRRRISETDPQGPTPLIPSILQIGTCLVALSSGALLARHAATVSAGHPAIPPDGVVHGVTMTGRELVERANRYGSLLDALAARGVRASLTSPGALIGLGPVGTVTTDCGQCSEGGLQLRWRVKPAVHQFVSADTFQMLGMRVLEGRGVTGADSWKAPRVAVVNRSLAAREFQNGEAIGRRIRVLDDADQWSTVVGVVEDFPAAGLGTAIQPRYTVFLSVLQHPPASVDLLLWAHQEQAAGLHPLANATLGPRSVEPAATLLREMIAEQATPLRWFGSQFLLQGWAMLAVAALGTFAAARLWVTALLGEFGVRRALGARRRQIVVYVLVRAAAVCGAGVVCGIWFGQTTWIVLANLVSGLDPWDPAEVVRYGLVLLFTVLAGSLPPALRAARAMPASLISRS
jgi:putative ABC transport system permease protein